MRFTLNVDHPIVFKMERKWELGIGVLDEEGNLIGDMIDENGKVVPKDTIFDYSPYPENGCFILDWRE